MIDEETYKTWMKEAKTNQDEKGIESLYQADKSIKNLKDNLEALDNRINSTNEGKVKEYTKEAFKEFGREIDPGIIYIQKRMSEVDGWKSRRTVSERKEKKMAVEVCWDIVTEIEELIHYLDENTVYPKSTIAKINKYIKQQNPQPGINIIGVLHLCEIVEEYAEDEHVEDLDKEARRIKNEFLEWSRQD